jgi:hypothetical protein
MKKFGGGGGKGQKDILCTWEEVMNNIPGSSRNLKHVSGIKDKSYPMVDSGIRIKQAPFKTVLRDLQRKPNLRHVQTKDSTYPRVDKNVRIKRVGKMPWLNDVERRQQRLRHVTQINDRSAPNLKFAWESRLEKLGVIPRADRCQLHTAGGIQQQQQFAGTRGGYDQQQGQQQQGQQQFAGTRGGYDQQQQQRPQYGRPGQQGGLRGSGGYQQQQGGQQQRPQYGTASSQVEKGYGYQQTGSVGGQQQRRY